MAIQGANFGHSFVDREAAGALGCEGDRSFLKVKLEVLGDFLETTLKGKVPYVIKIDVEGWEFQVLRGAEELLRRADAPILQVEFAPGYFVANGIDAETLRNEIVRHGYELYYLSGVRSLRRVRDGLDDLAGNLYAVKKSGPWLPRIQFLIDSEADPAGRPH